MVDAFLREGLKVIGNIKDTNFIVATTMIPIVYGSLLEMLRSKVAPSNSLLLQLNKCMNYGPFVSKCARSWGIDCFAEMEKGR